MRFSVGYQLPAGDEEDSIATIVADHRHSVAEVYFAWVGMASGRAPVGWRSGEVDWTAQARLEADLGALAGLGVRLNLLLNANCYGGLAVSQALANQVTSLVEHLLSLSGLDVVTTTSPYVAHVVKERFPEVETRASVNMRVGTVEGMGYVADLFDGFCVQRDYNRDLEQLDVLREWAAAHGKSLTLLANSGCLYLCSGQSFHDNLVAHEAEMAHTVAGHAWNPVTCWRYYRERDNWVSWLRNTWVRPEDVHQYDAYVSLVKLATRMHAMPRKVIEAYVRGRFHGNLMDLMEPSHSLALRPHVVDNDAFPDEWVRSGDPLP